MEIPDLIGSLRRLAQGYRDDEGRVLAAVLQRAMHLHVMPVDQFIRIIRDLEANGALEELQKRL